MIRKTELRAATIGGSNYDVDEASKETETGVISVDPETGEEIHSMTHQQFLEETDINTIVRRFGLTGELPQNLQMPVSGDFTEAKTFEETMQLMTQAQQEFMSLPADIRERFANDPGRLIAFLENPDNRDEAVKLGIVNKPAEKIRTTIDAIDELKAALTPPAKT